MKIPAQGGCFDLAAAVVPDSIGGLQDLALADLPWRRFRPGGPGDSTMFPLSSLAISLARCLEPIMPMSFEFLFNYHVYKFIRELQRLWVMSPLLAGPIESI
jgi:hypothetical protein